MLLLEIEFLDKLDKENPQEKDSGMKQRKQRTERLFFIQSKRMDVARVGDLFGFLDELLEGEDHNSYLILAVRFFSGESEIGGRPAHYQQTL